MNCHNCGVETPSNASFCMGCGTAVLASAPEIPSSLDLHSSIGGFVGRLLEMEDLRSALAESRAGRGQIVMISGEPGIGKTRTAEELAREGSGLGSLVLWGKCNEDEGAPPYWPWIQIIRNCLRWHDDLDNRLDTLPSLGLIGSLAPDLTLAPKEELTEAPENPEQARFRLMEAVTQFLLAFAQERPLLMVLDDLHWADSSSLQMLDFFSQHISNSPVLVIGTCRENRYSRRLPLSRTLGNLVRQLGYRSLPLRGLSATEVSYLMGEIGANQQLATAVHDKTEGNPLFVTQISQELRRENAVPLPTETISIPGGIKDAIGRRVSTLSPDCVRVLTSAAVISREFDYPIIAQLMRDLPEDRLVEVLEEGLEAGILQEISSANVRYQFAHALIQETLSEEISQARRARLHGQIGEIMESIHGVDNPVHAAELAHHFERSRMITGEEILLRYSRLAGEQALRSYAHTEAMEHFQRGLNAQTAETSQWERGALLFGLAQAQAATVERTRMAEVVSAMSEAFDCFKDASDMERAVSVAAYPLYPLIGISTGNARLIARALELVPENSLVHGRLLSRYGRAMAVEEGDHAAAAEAFSRAQTIAQQEHDLELELVALAEGSNVDMLYTQYAESCSKGLKALELAQQSDRPEVEIIARYSLFLSYLARGEMDSLQVEAETVLEIAQRLKDRFWITLGLRSKEDAAHLIGDWPTARSFSDQGLAVSPLETRNLCTRAMLEYQTGNFTEANRYQKSLFDLASRSGAAPTVDRGFCAMVNPLAARITGRRDQLPQAKAIGEQLLATTSKAGHVDLFARIGLGILAVVEQDNSLARQQYNALKPFRGLWVLFTMISVDRVLGLLSTTLGQTESALAHFQDAVDNCRRSGYRPELAWSLCGFSEMLLQASGSPTNSTSAALQTQAMSQLEEALALAEELDMPPLKHRISSLIASASDLPRSTPNPDGLTDREVEVLRFVAQGLSNKDIADQLILSQRTVQRHIANIYQKIDVHNRAEATAYVMSQLPL